MTLALLRRGLVAFGGAFAALSLSRAQGGNTMARIDFENATADALPPGITGALTGSGAPAAWVVLEDATAPAGPKVLAQTSTDKTDYRFPLAIFDAPIAADVDVTVRFRPVGGEIDQAAGIAVRLKDRNNYYVVRANALEDNVRLYRMVGGQRTQFAGTSAKVPSDKWQELRLTVRGSRFEVFLDGKSLFSATDATFTSAGRVALWTKADSVTYFDDLRIQTL
jgi:glycosyl hydrolase family 59 (putative galactocerebrosidase)